jgi:PAS domain S-box-containing protein
LIIASAFFLTSLFVDTHRSHFSLPFLLGLLAAQAMAIGLTAYSLSHFRAECRRTERAFWNTDCEFTSIFEHVLDGVLILDDHSRCLDANPAAATILHLTRIELIGQNIERFFFDSNIFPSRWQAFLENKSQRGCAKLLAGDGATLFVDFTAVTNYLPGRHVFILCDVTERTNAETSLRKSEQRFQQMANNIQEIFWMMDADTQEITYVNQAYATITGYSVEALNENRLSYRELIHPEDRIRILSKLHEVAHSGTFDEEFRFSRVDGAIRWVWARGFPVRAEGATRWLVGTAQDVTSRKQAEMKISEHLAAAEAARAEAEALRKSTLALSQNLAMDAVLDTLLQCISELVPFDNATVLFVEDGLQLMVAREAPLIVPRRTGLTLSASENKFLHRILIEKRAILLANVAEEPEWRDTEPLDRIQSWLGVSLVAAGHVIGVLSLGADSPFAFTSEHLRLAKSLAVPAAVAIQNARIHERAEIYAAELELRLQELRDTRKALQNVKLGS